ncbi:MAG: biotin/lipoyl-containing protein, partial [Planctomycetota bacterium]|nr:biotin/lipoyl-containing protein [Planctomycetota bacterium]
MATEIKLPELGDGIESGDILEVFVNVGDTISEGDDIVEVETDKASVPVPSTVSGTVASIDVEPGQTVGIGAVLITIEGNAAPAVETSNPTAEDVSETTSESIAEAPEPEP